MSLFTYFEQCNRFRTNFPQGEDLWQEMMAKKEKIEPSVFETACDTSGMLDEDETLEEFMFASDPEAACYKSIVRGTEIYFVQCCGFEFIYTSTGTYEPLLNKESIDGAIGEYLALNYPISLAYAISAFLDEYAVKNAHFDPEYDDEDEMYGSPDASSFQAAMNTIKEKGKLTRRIDSSWESGGYAPYNDSEARLLHEQLIKHAACLLVKAV